MKKKNILYYIGNLFIVISLLGFGYTVYPIVVIYLLPPPPPARTEKIPKGFTIAIAKINAYSNVIAGVDPWNEVIYQAALKKGVAHAKKTALPGENGTVFLFAHSSGSPWEVTHTNTIFLRLGELEKQDKISLDYQGKRYNYSVTDKIEVWPDQVSYLQPAEKNQLILMTCTPIGTSLKRLLVFAELSG